MCVIFLCYFKYMSTGILKEQVSDKRDPDLSEEEDIRMDEIRDEYCRDIFEEVYNKKNINILR